MDFVKEMKFNKKMIKYFKNEKEMFDYINNDNHIKYSIKEKKVYFGYEKILNVSSKFNLIKNTKDFCKNCKYFIFCANIIDTENANVYINNKCDIKFKIKF